VAAVDEIGPVVASPYVGCRFLLSGEPNDDGYYLDVSHHRRLAGLSAAQMRESVVDISADIVELLENVGSIRASLPPRKVSSSV